MQAIKFLTRSTTIKVNAVNANGFAALDIVAQRKLDVKADWTIGELLRCVGAISLKDTQLLTREPAASGTTQTETGSILTSHSGDPSNQGHERPENVGKKKEVEWLEKRRNALMVVSSLIAAMAFQAGLNPPGGVWQDHTSEHSAGQPIMSTSDPYSYNLLFGFNTTAFLASLSIILLFISGIPCFKRRFFMWILTVIMWVAVSAMALAYVAALTSLRSFGDNTIPWYVSTYIVIGWIVLMGILILAHMVRLIVKTIKFFLKLKKRSPRQPSSSDAQIARPVHIV